MGRRRQELEPEYDRSTKAIGRMNAVLGKGALHATAIGLLGSGYMIRSVEDVMWIPSVGYVAILLISQIMKNTGDGKSELWVKLGRRRRD